MQEANVGKTPTVSRCILTKKGSGDEVDATNYKQMIGSLMNLTATRPDLTYFVQVYETTNHYAPQGNQEDHEVSHGNCGPGLSLQEEEGKTYDGKNTGEYVFFLGTRDVSWSSKKQIVVTLSTTKIEFISAAMGACRAVWLRMILEKIGQVQEKSTTIMWDNSSTIKLSRNPILQERCKQGRSQDLIVGGELNKVKSKRKNIILTHNNYFLVKILIGYNCYIPFL